MDLQVVSVQSDAFGCRLDVDLDFHDPLKAKSTAKLEVEELDVIVDGFNTGSVNTRPLVTNNRTYVLGKIFRSAAAMVVIGRGRSLIEAIDDFESFRI